MSIFAVRSSTYVADSALDDLSIDVWDFPLYSHVLTYRLCIALQRADLCILQCMVSSVLSIVRVMEHVTLQLVHRYHYCWISLVLLLLLTAQGTKSEGSSPGIPYVYNAGHKTPVLKGNFSRRKAPGILDCGDRTNSVGCQNSLLVLTMSGYPWLVDDDSLFEGNEKKVKNDQNVTDRQSRFGDALDALRRVCEVYEDSRSCLQDHGIQDVCLLVGQQASLGLHVTFDFLSNHQQRGENLVHELQCLHNKRVLSMLPFQIGQRCGLGILEKVMVRQSNAILYIMNVSSTEMRMPSMLHLYCLPWNQTKRCVNTIVNDQCGSMAASLVQDFILYFQNYTRNLWKSIGVHEDICNFDIFNTDPLPAFGTALDTTYGRYLLATIQKLSDESFCHPLNSFLAYSACVLSSQELSEKARFNILQFAHQMPTFPYFGTHCERLEEFTKCWNLFQQKCGSNATGFELQSTLMVEGCKIQSEMDTALCKWQDVLLEYYIQAGRETIWPLVTQAWNNPMFLDSGVQSYGDIVDGLNDVIRLLQQSIPKISRKCGQKSSSAVHRLGVLLDKIKYSLFEALQFNHIWEKSYAY